MIFSSTLFLFLFLPITVLLYVLTPKNQKNDLLLFASLFFYGWGEPRYLLLLLLSILSNYLGAILIAGSLGKMRRIYLSGTVAVNIGLLSVFKYSDFLIQNINDVFEGAIPLTELALPIGISFFTFQAISYVVDVYRKDVDVQKNLYHVALYISFFPQLIAGPIVKYHDICEQLENRTIRFENLIYGSRRFVIGLGKKVLIANTLGAVADSIFALKPEEIDMTIAWLGALCYTLQIYFDFSGYSDMAIGLGAIFGFRFHENFNYPYIAKGITDFWRRWHISLGSWFREYLYIPLGGNRQGGLRTIANLGIVFVLTGLWHGASWTFVLWGAWHGFFIIIERISTSFPLPRKHIWRFLLHFYTLFVVIIGWVLFRSANITNAFDYITVMLTGNTVIPPFNVWYFLTNDVLLTLLAAFFLSLPVGSFLRSKDFWGNNLLARNNATLRVMAHTALLSILLLSMANIAADTYNPFLYFRF